MKDLRNIFSLLMVALMGLSIAACSEDDLDTNQYRGGVSLNGWGPNPVMRGGTLRFVGSNLDQLQSITIPGQGDMTNFEVVKSGTPSEVRLVLDKDLPQVGFITLKAKDGTIITTQTEIQYIEGIELTGFEPAEAMPGQTVTLVGDYLNLVQMVEFSDGVQISAENFVSQDRYKLQVIVPAEAKTGKVSVYTVDLTKITPDEEETEYQIITSEKAFIVGLPTVADAARQYTVKAGSTVSIGGSALSLIKAICFGEGGSQVELTDFTVNNEGTQLSFVLPAEAPDGTITLVTRSDVEIPAGVLTTVAPTECKAAPAPVKAGSVLTISGKDLDLVTAVEFPNADAIGVQATASISVIVPESAQEGNLTLRMANGKGVEVPFTLVKPAVTAYSANPVSAGGELTMTGTNLDLVKSVTFGEAEAAVEATATSLKVTVPMDAAAGRPVLNLKNGTQVEAPELSINEAVFCYFTELPAEDVELKAGDSFTLPVANGDKLTGVEINGEPCQYVLANNLLVIGIPATAKKGSKLRLISSNGEITYTFDFIPNTEVTTVLWTGQAVADEWKDQPYVLSDAGQELKDAGVVAGDIISFHIVPMSSDWKLQIVEGHWGPTYASICSIGNDTEGGKFTEYDLDANKGYFNLVMTQEMLDAAFVQQWWGGVFVLNGDNVVVDRITTTHYNSLETTVWQGEAVADNWGDQPYMLSDGGSELLEAGMKVGSLLRLYITTMESQWWLQVYEGHWAGQLLPEFNHDNWNLAEHNGAVEITVTDEIFTAITTPGGWGGSFILNGDNVVCTKITIE